jgi:hypothetical protein
MRQEYRDRTGSLLGYREQRSDRVDCRDRTGSLVGSYYPARNETRDRYGSLVGCGDLLSSLLP